MHTYEGRGRDSVTNVFLGSIFAMCLSMLLTNCTPLSFDMFLGHVFNALQNIVFRTRGVHIYEESHKTQKRSILKKVYNVFVASRRFSHFPG